MSVNINPKDMIIAPGCNQKSAIYVREQKGKFQRIRRGIAMFLMTLFVILPWIEIGGFPAILLDASNQQWHIFGNTLYPQDFPIVAGIFMVAAFALFFITTWLGRVWCGFLCPQTHWLFMFFWLEEKIEGSRNQRMKLDKQKMNGEKLIKKSLKHASWVLVAFLTATTFVSYFMPPIELYSSIADGSLGIQPWFWVSFFALCTWGNAGFLKEKMCLHMCPYARFQSAMFDKDTLLVGYDTERGENRGRRRRKDDHKEMGLGDCVDCNLCVDVCPTGIDIRNGLQYECINCGACVDACDQTMSQFNYPKGLISFTSEHELKGGKTHLFRPKIIGYAVICFVVFAAMTGYWFTRSTVELTVLRDRNVLYRVNNDDFIENSYQIKLLNKEPTARSFNVQAKGIDGIQSSLNKAFSIDSGEMSSLVITLTADPVNLPRRVLPVELIISDMESGEVVISHESRFYSE
ncbi:cytochrome c oxidase accessory protein CcoG [Psychrobium sp. nBUS_13]|uniref:cytochrome c oxidase accessory protein CcoG n=1 Tax=Psychrobium sp. nBUS_13 TaxID=3395319 RepID=UPI003EBF6CA8